jgi:hypothetical protein
LVNTTVGKVPLRGADGVADVLVAGNGRVLVDAENRAHWLGR